MNHSNAKKKLAHKDRCLGCQIFTVDKSRLSSGYIIPICPKCRGTYMIAEDGAKEIV